MLKLLDICFLSNADCFGLERVAILITSQGFWLVAFKTPQRMVTDKRYKTLKGAQADFVRQHVKGKKVNLSSEPHWCFIIKNRKISNPGETV